MVKVKLYTAAGEFVADVYSLPYQSWPQAFWWGQRMFVRADFRNLSHTESVPPPYYECSPLMVYSEAEARAVGLLPIPPAT